MEENKNQTEETNIEQMEVMKQLMEFLEHQNMQGQTQGFQEVFQYMAGMQLQLGLMAEELHNVKEQLAQATDTQPAPMKEKLTKQAEQLEGKVAGLMEKLTAIKDTLIETAAKALQAFRDKGQQGFNKVLDTGVVGIKNMISSYRNQLSDTLMNFEKTANQIDSIGDELKQIGNSTANVGRLIAGKGTKEILEEKPGVALTRVINAPIKRHISNLKNGMEKTGKLCEKLEQMSEKLQPEKAQAEKETQKQNKEQNPKSQDRELKKTEDKQSDRESVKERLEQMKVKTAAQKQPEKVQMKEKEQAASI